MRKLAALLTELAREAGDEVLKRRLTMAFHVGQKVVCVDDTGCYGPWLLRRGAIYTVTYIGDLPLGGVGAGVDVAEAKRALNGWATWYARRFRPLRDTSRQVELLKRLTLPKRERERWHGYCIASDYSD